MPLARRQASDDLTAIGDSYSAGRKGAPISVSPCRASVRSLLDTNVLVYANSADAPAKQLLSVALIRELRSSGDAVPSTQVLQHDGAVRAGMRIENPFRG